RGPHGTRDELGAQRLVLAGGREQVAALLGFGLRLLVQRGHRVSSGSYSTRAGSGMSAAASGHSSPATHQPVENFCRASGKVLRWSSTTLPTGSASSSSTVVMTRVWA